MPLWLRRQFTFNDGSFIYFNRECNDSNLKSLGNKKNENIFESRIHAKQINTRKFVITNFSIS